MNTARCDPDLRLDLGVHRISRLGLRQKPPERLDCNFGRMVAISRVLLLRKPRQETHRTEPRLSLRRVASPSERRELELIDCIAVGFRHGDGPSCRSLHRRCTNNYNPTQAGAYLNFPAPTTAATCGAGGTATMWSTMLDYAGNSSGLAPALGVFGGAEELASTFGGATNGYFTPYALETVTQWVPTGMGNSANGIPFYYLKLTQTVTNVSPTENNPWSFFISDYVEPIFQSMLATRCRASTCQVLAATLPSLLLAEPTPRAS
jgi:hypothetical protein